KKAQRQRAAAIGDANEQLPATAECDVGKQHLSFDDRALTASQRSDRNDLRAVFVAQRQQEKQVLNRRNVELRKALCKRFAYTAKRGDRTQLGGESGGASSASCSLRSGFLVRCSNRCSHGAFLGKCIR